MTVFRCPDCDTTFSLDRDIDVDDIECPLANCRSDDLVEFIEADDEEDEGEDED